jgi:hypothetical protein
MTPAMVFMMLHCDRIVEESDASLAFVHSAVHMEPFAQRLLAVKAEGRLQYMSLGVVQSP